MPICICEIGSLTWQLTVQAPSQLLLVASIKAVDAALSPI